MRKARQQTPKCIHIKVNGNNIHSKKVNILEIVVFYHSTQITRTFKTTNYIEFHPFYRPRRPLGRAEVYLYSVFRPRHYKVVRDQNQAPAAFYPRERPGTHFTGGCVGPRAGLDGGKSRPTGIQSPELPACSESLYRLSYPAHYTEL